MLVALTGYDQEANLRNSRDAGFEFHLAKPVTVGSLRQLLQSVKELKSSREGGGNATPLQNHKGLDTSLTSC